MSNESSTANSFFKGSHLLSQYIVRMNGFNDVSIQQQALTPQFAAGSFNGAARALSRAALHDPRCH
jgi:hypothetical protein